MKYKVTIEEPVEVTQITTIEIEAKSYVNAVTKITSFLNSNNPKTSCDILKNAGFKMLKNTLNTDVVGKANTIPTIIFSEDESEIYWDSETGFRNE